MRITMYLGHQEREGAMREIRMDLWLSVVRGGQEGIRVYLGLSGGRGGRREIRAFFGLSGCILDQEGDQVVPCVIRRKRAKRGFCVSLAYQEEEG